MFVKVLQDKVTYKKTNEHFVDKFSNYLLKEKQDFLTKFSFSTSNIYGLPKVHKSKIIQEVIQV